MDRQAQAYRPVAQQGREPDGSGPCLHARVRSGDLLLPSKPGLDRVGGQPARVPGSFGILGNEPELHTEFHCVGEGGELGWVT